LKRSVKSKTEKQSGFLEAVLKNKSERGAIRQKKKRGKK